MKINDKGEMTWGVIMGAVLAIIILVVLIIIFTGGFKSFSGFFKQTQDANKQSGGGQLYCLPKGIGTDCLYKEGTSPPTGGECMTATDYNDPKRNKECPAQLRYYLEKDDSFCCTKWQEKNADSESGTSTT